MSNDKYIKHFKTNPKTTLLISSVIFSFILNKK
jgi:hypothetical protein